MTTSKIGHKCIFRPCFSDFLFSIKYEKSRCIMCFFHLNFLNAWGILAQKIYNAHAIFHQFSDFKNGGQSQQTSILG